MDLSETQCGIRNQYLGIVIGTDQAVDFMKLNLGCENIHMSQIRDKKKQNEIISTLKFGSGDVMALCLKINMNATINKIMKLRKMKKSRISKTKLYRTYHYMLTYHIRQRITEFLAMHNQDMSNVIFQCDGDCKKFLKESGLRHVDGGNAYMLSDVVAWANHANREPRGVIAADISDEIRHELVKKLGLNSGKIRRV